ncbi:MAG: hypothetical protein E7167_00680 [Firmicutes bacterium]|nr:hypothetical protein [Bacillota bacterium]
MNEKEYFQANDDGIGLDPTMMPVIESLDDLPADAPSDKKNKKENNKKGNKPKSKTPDPNKKSGDLLKKILFTVVVLLLMAGVSFGVYYYLSLGTKSGGKSKFTLEDKLVFVGETLPTSVMEYGDFSTVDVSECSLNILDVNVNEPGEYNYSIVCGKAKYTAKIIVQERVSFDIATKLVYKQLGDEVEASEFITTEREDYNISFVSEEAVKDYLTAMGGPHVVEIKVVNSEGQETIVSSLLYVLSEQANMYLTCNSSKQSVGDYNFTIIDKIAFDSSRNDMGASIRSYNYSFDSDAEYENMKKQIIEGKIIINNHEGYVLIDNVNKKIQLVNLLTMETLEEEYGSQFPTTYTEINGFYRNTKRYSCSI